MNNTVFHRSHIVKTGVWLFFGIFLYFYLNLFGNALIDDAFITLRYAKTLLSSGTWGFFPGVVANSATSPFNVLLLTVISLFTGPTTTASLWLYLLCLLVIAFLLARLSLQLTGSELYGWLAVSALAFNPLLTSTIGLESIVFTTLFVLALYCYQFQKWTMLAIALGLLTLTRADGVLFFLIFLLFAPGNKIRTKLVLVYLFCILPWYLFSWVYLGSFLPDTFFIKTNQSTWFQWDFFNGMTSLYYFVYPVETLLAFAFLPLIALLLHRKIRETPVLIIVWLAGLIHFVGYSALKVPPFHWYYVPQVISLILLGSLGLGVAYRTSRRYWQQRAWGLTTAIFFLIPALGMTFLLGRENFVVREMPIHSNWATHEQYKQIGLWLKENEAGHTIQLQGSEIGTLSYYCDCRLLDRFSDRSWLKDYMIEHSNSGIMSTLLEINFAFYSKPAFPWDGYILKAYATTPGIDGEAIKEWEISTKWIGRARVILIRQFSD
ncbi:MAG TPA: hypothetical protein VK897_15460 [Anaerolineales bacterium]|nr:hypothetical protein [Anaerolineales bacterium]